MEIEHRTGDIFAQKDITHMGQCCNCFHTQGAGIARIIKERYPEVYEADCKTPYGTRDKMGTFSGAKCKDGFIIYNIYAQFGYGRGMRQIQYDALSDALEKLKPFLLKAHAVNPVTFGIPYGFGSINAGGRWPIVQSIFETTFSDSPINLVIVRLSTQQELS